jgi:uncharacterized protein YjaZ
MQEKRGAQVMRAKGILKGKKITLEDDLGIEGEVEVEVTFRNEFGEEAFGIWEGREDIQDSTAWVKVLREREWVITRYGNYGLTVIDPIH